MHAGREKMLYRVEPGQLCVHTLTNLLNDQDYQAQATAEIGSGLGWMDAGTFRTAYRESNALQRLVVASLSERCFHFVRDIHDLCFRSVSSRLSETLLELVGMMPLCTGRMPSWLLPSVPRVKSLVFS